MFGEMIRERARGVRVAAVCMYHDQGLIPVKLLARDEAGERDAWAACCSDEPGARDGV